MIISVTIWRWPHPKGGEAWTTILLAVNYNLTITKEFIMSKNTKKSPVAAAIANNNVDDSNINSNKEVTMSDATSAAVTFTLEAAMLRIKELEESNAKKDSAKTAKKCTKVWTCIMSKKDIRESDAPPQMQIIMNAVRLETEKSPATDWHQSDVIIDRLVDEDGDTMMTFSKTYRGASEAVLRKRIVEIMNYYAHPDMVVKYDLDRDTYDCK